MRRLAAVAALSLAMLGACGGKGERDALDETGATSLERAEPTDETLPPESEPPAQPETIPAIAIPSHEAPHIDDVTIEFSSDQLEAQATIDGDIGSFSPSLFERIQADVKSEIEASKKNAAAEAGRSRFNTHDYQSDYIESASVGDIISIEYQTMTFTGGAHLNYRIGGILHDRSTGNDLPASALLSADGEATLKAFLMEELAKQKVTRLDMLADDLPILREEVAEVFPEGIDRWLAHVTLVPSTQPEKFGGLVVHYSPYDVGAYAEGAYNIVVPASELAELLNPIYMPMFDGAPIIDAPDEH